jgi:hypothetical protein
MNATQIKAAARKALMVADPLYYSWPAEQQERFRATRDQAVSARINAVLLHELLGIACTAENADDIWDDISPSQRNDLNWARLLTTGIGEDFIYLNEIMAENTSLLDFNTLYDYDFKDYLFQEQAKKKDSKNYAGQEYYPWSFPPWARLIIDEKFHYSTLFSLARYLVDEIEQQGRGLIGTLIPHQYVEGKNHGKKENGGFLWDKRVDAAGQEQQLDELQERWNRYTQERWITLSQSFVDDAPAVFVADDNQDGELNRDFIFNNAAALKRVRWRHFLADCEQIKGDFSVVSEHEKTALEQAQRWLRETHQDIMDNYDPRVAKLRKRNKVIVAPGAFDSLIDGGLDEPS